MGSILTYLLKQESSLKTYKKIINIKKKNSTRKYTCKSYTTFQWSL